MHAISSYHGNRHPPPVVPHTQTHTHAHKQTVTITTHCAAASLARSVMSFADGAMTTIESTRRALRCDCGIMRCDSAVKMTVRE